MLEANRSYFVWYLCYLAIVDSIFIQWDLMVPGHTKFYPDSCFGLGKREVFSQDTCHATDVFERINNSSAVNNAVCGTKVPWRNWKDFLGQFFNGKLPGIRTIRHLRFSKDFPAGTFQYKDSANDAVWKTASVLKTGVTKDVIKSPAKYEGFKPIDHASFVMTPPPLTKERTKQLEKIRKKYVFKEEAKKLFLLPPDLDVIEQRRVNASKKAFPATFTPRATRATAPMTDDIVDSTSESGSAISESLEM